MEFFGTASVVLKRLAEIEKKMVLLHRDTRACVRSRAESVNAKIHNDLQRIAKLFQTSKGGNSSAFNKACEKLKWRIMQYEEEAHEKYEEEVHKKYGRAHPMSYTGGLPSSIPKERPMSERLVEAWQFMKGGAVEDEVLQAVWDASGDFLRRGL